MGAEPAGGSDRLKIKNSFKISLPIIQNCYSVLNALNTSRMGHSDRDMYSHVKVTFLFLCDGVSVLKCIIFIKISYNSIDI